MNTTPSPTPARSAPPVTPPAVPELHPSAGRVQHHLEILRHELALYSVLVRARMRAQWQYRSSFLIMTAVTFIGLLGELLAIVLLLHRFDTIAGWTLGEIALLYALASISFGMAEMIGAGFDLFPQVIRRGEFDQVLLRPVSIFTQTLASDFQLRRLGRIAQGSVALAISMQAGVIDWTLARVLYLPLVLGSGMLLFLALLVCGATLCFWTVESAQMINVFTNGGIELATYPLPIYHVALQRFFTFVVPTAFVSYVPALFLLGRLEGSGWPIWSAFAPPLTAAAFTMAAVAFWRVGVRHYRSTGS